MARAPLDDDDAVSRAPAGYGNPPSRHRIRDGEIRNPWGRRGKPKPPVEFLDELVTIRVDGEPRRVTRRVAMDYFLFAKAAKGDARAIRLLEDRARQRQTDPSEAEGTALSPVEQAAFDRFVRRRLQHLGSDETE